MGGVAALPKAPDTAALLSKPSADLDVAASQVEALAKNAHEAAFEQLEESGPFRADTCTKDNVSVRREWGVLKDEEKKEYINAVLCLQRKPANTPQALAPGAKTRYDDFVAVHINQTMTIHETGTFLSWHRWFTWAYEQALRNECGYTGTQPYWDWSQTARTGFAASPIFDGSAVSLSGNGAPVPNQGEVLVGGPDTTGLAPIRLPPGSGGGCVYAGPFSNMSVNLGPALLFLPNGSHVSASNPLDYNARCLRRDLTDAVLRANANASSIATLVLDSGDIHSFQTAMQGAPGASLGVHGGAHYALGGDPGRDFFVSPGDPAFFLHHAMVDRVWWVWQMRGQGVRLPQVAQTGTFLDVPKSRNTSLGDAVDLGFALGSMGLREQLMRVGDLVSTVGGPFCYVYE
ncbi:uncharacterized protein K452DRAFT_219628 [Aplosporella prunicola CBS 121167]|uniref:Tyrosinase copper-binding domain-containing protein n=1 Tax=Aplosporella prunicola CBS 121167 TaxID=1176127 RepID=A0A6A6BQV3_9PEZI|nr:uncharacterized protein K452DRAFT_219628 [Aplosporella prunicola CBS 121167]KAF2146390.1 hypothetical protein K452DRAFT_219628 [Aplosporella prunicola CBS 121167]